MPLFDNLLTKCSSSKSGMPVKKLSTMSSINTRSEIPLIASHVAEKSVLKKAMLTGNTSTWKKRSVMIIMSQQNL